MFGDGAPPPVDPELGYPPSSDPMGSFDIGTTPIEGFVFALQDGTAQGSRIRFTVELSEQYEEWCAGQTPYLDEYNEGEEYYCIPNWITASGESGCYVVNPDTHEHLDMDCMRLAMCESGRVCECNANGCWAVDSGAGALHFDVSFSADRADGSVQGLDEIHNVRMTPSD